MALMVFASTGGVRVCVCVCLQVLVVCMCVCVQCKAQVVSPTLFIAGFSAAANHGSHGVCKYGWCVECAGILGCVCVCVWGGGGGEMCTQYVVSYSPHSIALVQTCSTPPPNRLRFFTITRNDISLWHRVLSPDKLAMHLHALHSTTVSA